MIPSKCLAERRRGRGAAGPGDVAGRVILAVACCVLTEGHVELPVQDILDGRCCKTLAVKDSHRESMRLDGAYEQAITRPLPHDELVQLHGVSAQARIPADLARQGDDLARAA